MEIEETTEEEIYTLLYEELSLQRFTGDPARFRKSASYSGGSLGLQTLREMLVTLPWDFNEPSLFQDR